MKTDQPKSSGETPGTAPGFSPDTHSSGASGLLGKRIECCERNRFGRSFTYRGVVIEEIPAELLDVRTGELVPAFRFILMTAKGRTRITTAVRATASKRARRKGSDRYDR